MAEPAAGPVCAVMFTGANPDAEAAVWDRLADLAARGAITTPVGAVYGFEDVARMIASQDAPPAGKSVVRIASV